MIGLHLLITCKRDIFLIEIFDNRKDSKKVTLIQNMYRTKTISEWKDIPNVFSLSVMSDSLWPHALQPSRLLCPWDSLGKSTEVGSHSFSRGSSRPRDRTQISCIAGRFFTVWATRELQVWRDDCKVTRRFSTVWGVSTPYPQGCSRVNYNFERIYFLYFLCADLYQSETCW